ncbi:hypothetical protein [Alloactinosynnema sp. L-07]|uniref:hypothetical protein n=1 Tax=Alloactinosynnema sp. L-07 TaxID=1653480 RepID=UPI0012F778CF|nr:hypothetical protein [Alloactinosynnema sp. L-07]
MGNDLRVLFATGPALTSASAKPNELTVAGRLSVIDRTDSGCAIVTQHVSMGRAVIGGYEQARVIVESNDQACAKAKAVAELVWPRLPPA